MLDGSFLQIKEQATTTALVSKPPSGPYAPPLQRSPTFQCDRVPRNSHCKPAQVDAQKGQGPIPAEVQADGQPEVAADDEGVAQTRRPTGWCCSSASQVKCRLSECARPNSTATGRMVANGPMAFTSTWKPYPRNSISSPTAPNNRTMETSSKDGQLEVLVGRGFEIGRSDQEREQQHNKAGSDAAQNAEREIAAGSAVHPRPMSAKLAASRRFAARSRSPRRCGRESAEGRDDEDGRAEQLGRAREK